MRKIMTLSVSAVLGATFAAIPALAFAAPGDNEKKNVVDGPDIAKGAETAPGNEAIGDLIDAIGFYAIIASLIGLLLSGLILAIGPRLGFNQASTVGKIGIIASLGVAFLVGIAATLINFFYNAGS